MRERSGATTDARMLTTVGLFSGIGGLELGFERAGFTTASMCEIWDPAAAVLRQMFPEVPLVPDVRGFAPPVADVVLAGFPCTDLSPAGGTLGINGPNSGLVEEVFRVVHTIRPRFVVLENVPNMLLLHKGAAMRHISEAFDRLGYRWAYRTLDTRFTGLPQRRLRVLMVAARDEDPAWRLFRSDVGPDPQQRSECESFGFYWTEGRGGLGWARNAVPTLKGGSTIGIPSPPAVYLPAREVGRQIVTLSIADGERLQGFPPGWTDASVVVGGRDHRWKLLGNAVPVDVAEWVAQGLRLSSVGGATWSESPIAPGKGWPPAARGGGGKAFEVAVSAWPELRSYRDLTDVVDLARLRPLSYRASAGFLRRIDESSLALDQGFEDALQAHVQHMRRIADRSRASKSGSSSKQRVIATHSKDMGPEYELRHELWSRGLRYFIHRRPVSTLRHRGDLVFPSSRVVVDVRGCFWHACPEHSSSSRPSVERWASRLKKNRERDLRIEADFRAAGWQVVVVWEHDDVRMVADDIERLVRQPSRPAAPSGRA